MAVPQPTTLDNNIAPPSESSAPQDISTNDSAAVVPIPVPDELDSTSSSETPQAEVLSSHDTDATPQ